jgi:hypothetical protein
LKTMPYDGTYLSKVTFASRRTVLTGSIAREIRPEVIEAQVSVSMKLFAKDIVSEHARRPRAEFIQPAKITVVLQALYVDWKLRQGCVTTQLLLDLLKISSENSFSVRDFTQNQTSPQGIVV